MRASVWLVSRSLPDRRRGRSPREIASKEASVRDHLSSASGQASSGGRGAAESSRSGASLINSFLRATSFSVNRRSCSAKRSISERAERRSSSSSAASRGSRWSTSKVRRSSRRKVDPSWRKRNWNCRSSSSMRSWVTPALCHDALGRADDSNPKLRGNATPSTPGEKGLVPGDASRSSHSRSRTSSRPPSHALLERLTDRSTTP